jgi:dihydrofolate synthase/folylpolyglutamate synthase
MQPRQLRHQKPVTNLPALNKYSLQDWLDYIESLHPEEIELGLDRVERVLQNLNLTFPGTRFITIAGTNGKGSTLAYLESIYLAAGYHVSSYTSPHLMRYNERVRLDGIDVDDNALCQAFVEVESARDDVQLTYFEFGTLATLVIFCRQAPDIALLETGLGGRLDAVNVINADLAIVTSVALDHTEWLGDSREKIGWEKAGIFRKDRPAICSDPSPPKSISTVASEVGATLYCLGSDFFFEQHDTEWQWRGGEWSLEHLPMPGLAGEHQLQNASAALAAIELLNPKYPVNRQSIEQGLKAPQMHGRIEVIDSNPQLLLDVSHNPQAVEALARYLEAHAVNGKTRAILGMMRDKDIGKSLAPLKSLVDHWYLIDLPGPRGASAATIFEELKRLNVQAPMEQFPDATAALRAAQQQTSIDDRIVVFGSFVTVSAIMAQL